MRTAEHYGRIGDPYEVIRVLDEWGLNFNRSSAVKYLYRADKKLGHEEVLDLLKAAWYCLHEVERIEPGLSNIARAVLTVIQARRAPTKADVPESDQQPRKSSSG